MAKHKDHKGGYKPPSIDGIVQSGRTIGFPNSSSYEPKRQVHTPTLDNFNRHTDGFTAAREAMPAREIDMSEASEAQLLDEPIVLDHIEERKRKLKFRQRHAKFTRRLKRTALTLMIVILAGAGYFAFKLYHTEKRVLAGGGKSATVCADDVDASLLNREGDSRINILLLGIGGPGHDGSDLTDTIMLASIDPINNKVALLSIPRDLWVNVPNSGSRKINEAYYYGKLNSQAKTQLGKQQDGVNLLDKTLQPIIDGVPIHYHVILDFAAFRQMVDALGGITVNVPETLYDPTVAWENHGNPTIASKGPQELSGKQALLYVRSRETSSDFARSQRQRLVIAAIKQKALSAGTFSNPLRVSSLLDSLGRNVYTDFSSTDIKCLYRQTSTIPASAISSLDMVTPPNNLLTTGNMGGRSVVEPRAGLYEYAAIHTFLHNSLKDGLVVRENAAVEIYNATSTAGLATNASNLLKSYGYHVTTVASTNGQAATQSTILVDLNGGKDKYTRHYLEKRLGVTAVSSIPDGYGITPAQGASFVIILGNDAITSSTSQ
jgi:LCP family protein required for cell wall assembly